MVLQNILMITLCYKCGYKWNYKGKQRGKDNLSCPRCSYRLRFDRVIIEDLDLHTKQKKLHDSSLELYKTPTKIHTYIHKKIKPRIIFNLNNLDPEMFGLEKEHTPYKKIIESPQTEFIEIEEGSNLCDVHNLPASYDDLDKIWTCRKCREFETPNARPIIYPSAQINKIQKEKFKIIPRDPIKLLEHQRSFF